MKKFSKIISCLSAFAMCISTLGFSGGLSAYSTIDASNGFSDSQIAESPVKPEITIDRHSFYYESVHGGDIVEVKIVLSGENVDNNYCYTGFRIMFPIDTSRYHNPFYENDYMLTVAKDKDGNPDVEAGEAIESLTSHVEWCTDKYGSKNGIYLSTEGDGNKGKTGVMYKVKFKFPNWIGGGEEFPISIEYQDDDCFTNYENDETGKLMQSYLFTKGIRNGEIEVDYMTATAAWTDYYTTTTKSTTRSTYTDTSQSTTAYYTTTSTTGNIDVDTSQSTTKYYTTTATTTRNTYTDTSAIYTTTGTYSQQITRTETTTSTMTGSIMTGIATWTATIPTITTETPVQTTTATTTKAPVITGTGYENWTMFEDTIVSIEDNKVTFAERGKTSVMNNGYNMDMIKNAGVGSKVSVEAIVSPSGSILNIIGLEILEKPDKFYVPDGDANGDGKVSVADAVIIMQALANPEEFSITQECADAADVVNKGDGITSMDALAIQMIDIGLLNIEDLPITSEKLQEIMN